MRPKLVFLVIASMSLLGRPALAGEQAVYVDGNPRAKLIVAEKSAPPGPIAERTINGYLKEQFGWSLPVATEASEPGLYIVAATDPAHPLLADLARQGLSLATDDLGDEGFRIVTREAGNRRFVVILAATPAGFKYGCQELVFFHLPATVGRATIDWPIEVKKRPEFAYRGIYMLPCWSQHDTIASWRRVLRFNSEITVNRNWFWLNGFPLLKQYGGDYAGTDLSKPENVRPLIALCREERMKFYIGGGWFTWHHEKHSGGSIDRGVQYYLDMIDLLPGAEGIYLEPAGEGSEAKESVWRERTAAFERLAKTVCAKQPQFEFAVAIGKFNAQGYRQAVHAIDAKRIFWWWCWGDPILQRALDEHPLVLRWHTNVRMSDYHGSCDPPAERELALTGIATSYDPGQGFGNRWNGYATLWGAPRARDFHPHTMPYFYQQYWFRERCWDVRLTEERFAPRLARRLFDADVPAEAIQHYVTLSKMCGNPRAVKEHALAPIDAFVRTHADRGTPRNRDTLARMREAIDGIRKVRGAAKAKVGQASSLSQAFCLSHASSLSPR